MDPLAEAEEPRPCAGCQKDKRSVRRRLNLPGGPPLCNKCFEEEME